MFFSKVSEEANKFLGFEKIALVAPIIATGLFFYSTLKCSCITLHNRIKLSPFFILYLSIIIILFFNIPFKSIVYPSNALKKDSLKFYCAENRSAEKRLVENRRAEKSPNQNF